MRRWRAAACALVTVLAAPRAWGCPCNLVAGTSAPLTQPGERVGASVGLSVLHELGSYGRSGRYTPDPTGVRANRAALELALAWRPAMRWELWAASSVGVGETDLPGAMLRERTLGDSLLRVRYDARTTGEAGAWPAIGLTAAVRAPTATAVASAGSSAAAPGVGLGAWELALGADVRRDVGRWFQANVSGEVGWRAGSATETNPGMRVSAGAAGVFLPSWRVAVAVGAGLWWEAAATHAGQTLAGTGVTRVTATAAVTVRLSEATRCTVGGAVDPPLGGFGENTVASARATVTLAWSR